MMFIRKRLDVFFSLNCAGVFLDITTNSETFLQTANYRFIFLIYASDIFYNFRCFLFGKFNNGKNISAADGISVADFVKLKKTISDVFWRNK